MEFNLIVATTLDGKIAQSQDQNSTDWTSKEDALNMRAMLNESDVIIVGRKTYELAKPLQKRNAIVFTSSVNDIEIINEKCVHFNTQNADISKYVREKGYNKIAVLGGATTYNYFLTNNLINNLYITIEPVIFGSGINVFNEEQNPFKKLQLVSTAKLNEKGTLLLHYTLEK